MRFHVLVAMVVVVLALLLRVGFVEFAILVLTVSLVLAVELVNTTVEAVVDLVTEDYHPLAKVAKDAAAGAVLVCSVGAVFVGVFVFWDEVFGVLAYLFG